MSEFAILVALVGAAFLAGILYYLAWRWSAAASTIAKVLVRGVVPIIALAGIAYAVLTPSLQMADKSARFEAQKRFEYRRPEPQAERNAPTAVPGEKKAVTERADEARRQQAERAEAENAQRRKRRVEAQRKQSTGRGILNELNGASGGASEDADRDVGGDDEVAAAAAPPEETTAGEEIAAAKPPPPPSTAPQQPTAAQPTPEAAAVDKEDTSDWDIVPVFYGTDRQRADNAERLDYDGNRGRRLELGQALVSVPKSHQVPNIERPWAVRIPYFNVTIYEEAEDPKKHFVMQEIKALSRAEFLAVVRKRLESSKAFKDQAFVFVHGYNTSFENGVYRTAQIAYDLEFDGAPFVYSWPSGGGLASYTYDRESSGQSTPYMRDFLKLVINETGAKAVSIIAHSMGNQPILQVLRDLKRSTPDDVIISQIILAAPDVDRDNFENIAKEILGLAKGVTLYVAANDQALQFSRRFHGGVARAGDVPSQGPVVIPGIDTIDITAASTDSLGINHSGYAENNALLKDIGRLIATGAPPNKRHPPEFQRIEQAKGGYWKYPPSE